MFDVFWFRFPLFRSLFALILGIVLQSNFKLDGAYIIGLGILNVSIYAAQFFLKSLQYRSVCKGLILQIWVLLLGLSLLKIEQLKYEKFILSRKLNLPAFVQIVEKQSKSNTDAQYLGKLFVWNNHTNSFETCGMLQVNNQKKIQNEPIIGNNYPIQLQAVQDFQGNQHEHEFNFAIHFIRKGIYGQLNCLYNWENTNSIQPFSINRLLYFAQNYLKQFISNRLPNTETASVLLALIDGDDSLIPKQLMAAYAATGTLHVLAVSGMHVSLIFAIIEFLMSWIKVPAFKIPKLIIQLLLVWMYAILCGLSPSILRATLMISFYAVAKIINRPQQQLNLLINTAFVMLLAAPNLLFDTGFQLSFIAVLGLLLFYESICSMLHFKLKITQAIWKLSAATIAAQIATLPLSIVYFHQFPLLFLPANLVLIPICTLAIYWGLLLVCLPNLPLLFWKSLALLLDFINQFTRYLASFKYATLNYLYLSTTDALLLGFVICCVYLNLKVNYSFFYRLAMLLLILIAFHVLTRNYQLLTQNKIQFYAYQNHPCMAVINGPNALLIADSTILKKQPYLMGLKLNKNTQLNCLPIHPNFYSIVVQNYSIKFDQIRKQWSIQFCDWKGSNNCQKRFEEPNPYYLPKNSAFRLILY